MTKEYIGYYNVGKGNKESEVRTMKIYEAVEKALKEKKPITRRGLFKMGFMILPTNSSECCYVLTEDMKKRPGRHWNPTADDLIADDWIVVEVVQRRPEMRKCPVCGSTQVSKQDNFCTNCGTKLKLVCDCWVKKGSYNCNESSCPGYRLNYKELKES